MPQLTTRRARTGAAACAAGLVAGLALVAAPSPASADDSNNLTVTYDAVGTSTLSKTNSTLALGPSVLTTSLNPADGSFTGHLPLPSTQTTFKAFGLLPISATVNFVEAAPVVGKLTTANAKQSITSTAKFYIKLTNVKAAGLPTFQGNRCQTKDPVSIPANSNGAPFNLITGGKLTGTYTLGSFANCGLTTGLINLLVPGSGNTVSLTVSNGQIQQ